MVGRGEVLERMTTVVGAAGDLEALWQAGGVGVEHRLPVLLCPPHPRLGGSMDSAILAEIVWHLGRHRHPTLRFNWRGVSASAGEIAVPWLPAAEPVDFAPLLADAEAALTQLLSSTGAREVAVVGVSVGAFVAARLLATHPQVARGALVSPPIQAVPDGLDVDVVAGLAGSGCAVVVVVGDDDRYAPVDALDARCRPFARVQVVRGADHGFVRGLTACAALVADACDDGRGDDDDD
ncbi:MAG TPA: alpha/beta fold hydrolase [Myxococcota bacterium]